MALTTFEEEIYLRALTGRLVGKAIADLGVNKLAVVAQKNVICTAIATATEAAYLTLSGGVTYHFLAEEGNVDELAERIKEFAPQVVLLQFGGETPIEETKKLFTALLRALASHGVPGDIVVHVRIFAAGGLKEALSYAEVKKYLSERNVYVYTVGFEEGKVYVNKVKIPGLELERLREYQVTLEHADLLNRSLKNRRVVFA